MASQGNKTLPRAEDLTLAVRSAHNIALLELLDPRPQGLADRCQRASTHQGDESRKLSIREERELATSLAFLAGISDCPDHVVGVCVQELPDIGGCQIMVAINKRLPADGDEVLRKIQKGLEQIFGRLSVLSTVSSTQERTAVKETVYNDIIALCHNRILSRLRSRHAQGSSYKGMKRNKRFLGSVVRDFIDLPWRNNTAEHDAPSIPSRNLNRYRSELRTLLAGLDEFEAADVAHHENLSRLVRSITQVIDSVPVGALLACVRDHEMDPLLRRWLLGCFTKIRRYSEVASILCHRARRISMLRDTRVRIVSGVVNMADTSVSGENTMSIWQYLARFQYRGAAVQMGMLPTWLRGLVQSKYSQSVCNILKEAKVHAEIQLLAYYENQHAEGGGVRPRIMASSKKACALCNTCIAIHGEYRVPKSHGKLYRGWKLPAAHQNGALQEDLNAVLESQISEALARLMPLSRRPPIQLDNESSIYSFHLSASLLTERVASIISEHHTAGAAVVDGADPEPEVQVTSCSSNQSQAAGSTRTEHATTGETGDEGEEPTADCGSAYVPEHVGDRSIAPSSSPHDSRLTDASRNSLVRQPADVRLEHGRETSFSPSVDGTACCFRSRRVELLVDEASGGFSLELLSTTEAEGVLRDETRPVAELRSISPEIDVLLPTCAGGQAYISCGDEVIRICARPG